jgi:hypothetical protein
MAVSMLEQAMTYRALGWKVMPLYRPVKGICSCGDRNCASAGKHPALPGWRSRSGMYAPEISLQHPNTLRRWFERNDRNVAILTGRISGLAVLDIDSEEGELNAKSRGVPEGGSQAVTGKGRHVYFAYPFDRVRDGDGLKNLVGAVQGADFRGDGGYVAAPPSLHASGREYRWVENSLSLALPPCPDWLLELAYRPGEARKAEAALSNSPNARDATKSTGADGEKFHEGERNSRLFRELTRLRAVSRFSDRELCRTAAILNRSRCVPPLLDSEVEHIVKQVCGYPVGHSAPFSPGSVQSGERQAAAGRTRKQIAVSPEMAASMLSTFEPENSLRPEFIAGLFRRGYPSILVAEPGLGKTILAQRLVCDLSLGGPVWGGFSSSDPKNTLMFCGEAGLVILNERLKSSGWNFNSERIKILDSRTAWKGGLYPALDNDEGRDVFRSFIESVKPDLVVIDSLGSFAEDESGREAMKSVFDFLLSTGDRYGCAHLLVHHLRKRKNNERFLPLDMSEVIGSSVITRHSALVIGMERRRQKDSAAALAEANAHANEIIVRSLKTWDKPFQPFSFTIEGENIDGAERLSIRFSLNPPAWDDKQARVWGAVRADYGGGAEFRKSDIAALCEGVSPDYVKKLLTEWTGLGRLERLGANRGTRYRLAAPLRDAEGEGPPPATKPGAEACRLFTG